MIGVVLGNGPSKVAFNNGGHMVLGCNIPGNEYRVDATVICDEEIVWVLKANPNLINLPVILSTRAFEKMKELGIVDNYYVLRVFNTKEWYNTAHYAAEYLIEQGCTEIEVWGCDSVFEDDISSETDRYVLKLDTKPDKLIRNWRRIWNDIFDSNEGVKFKIIRIEK